MPSRSLRKKTAEAIQREIAREVDRLLNAIFQDRRKSGRLDLEAVETLIRSAMHRAGAAALTKLLQHDPPDEDQRMIPCSRGHSARYKELRSKTIPAVPGPVELNRPYYLCAHCSKGQCPVDVELGVAELESSPGVRRMEAVVGSEMPFASGCEPMKVLAGLDVPAKAIERASEAIGAQIARRDAQEIGRAKQTVLPVVVKRNIPKMYVPMDGVQVPVVRKETEGRAGRIEGRLARTRECKLGCVFTQTTVDKEGWPIRDPDSTTCVGAIETAAEFGFRLYTEAWGGGWEWATIKVVIGDGAVWIWNPADRHFPGAIQIVDLHHAREHLWKIAAWLHPNDVVAKKLRMTPMKDLLDSGQIEPLVARLREIAAEHAISQPGITEEILKEAEYFETNTSRMRYPEFRAQGLFAGSGVIEAGCKAVIGSRLKQSGMFRTVRGANDIIALRCRRLNGRFEDYREATPAA